MIQTQKETLHLHHSGGPGNEKKNKVREQLRDFRATEEELQMIMWERFKA